MYVRVSAGEAIWDKPHVVAAREAHARALEERYSGLPQPLLLKVSYLAVDGFCSWRAKIYSHVA